MVYRVDMGFRSGGASFTVLFHTLEGAKRYCNKQGFTGFEEFSEGWWRFRNCLRGTFLRVGDFLLQVPFTWNGVGSPKEEELEYIGSYHWCSIHETEVYD